MEHSRARPNAPSPIPARSWIAGRREKIDANIAPLSANTAVTATRARRAERMKEGVPPPRGPDAWAAGPAGPYPRL